MSDLLSVEDLTVAYTPLGGRPAQAVSSLSFRVPGGSVVGIVGESGSGKSTAALALLGLTRRSGKILSGSVQLEGRELMSLSAKEWERVRGREIGLITQNPRASLHPVLRVGDQIAAVFRHHTKATASEARERVIELLKLVGINDPVRRYEAFPDELSGGMAQRVVIAMALACSPRLIIADEPTSGLDVTVQAQILDDLTRSVRTVGSGLVLVTQDLSIVANYCNDVYLLHAGEVVESCGVDEFFGEPGHPAATALLVAQRREQLDRFVLRGMPVDMRARPSGCQLSRRCPFAQEADGCTATHPDLKPAGANHLARCHRVAAVRAAWREERSQVDE